MCRGPGVFLGNYYGDGSGPNWHDNLHCLGNETSLTECGLREFRGYCRRKDDVSIVCDDGSGKCCELLTTVVIKYEYILYLSLIHI